MAKNNPNRIQYTTEADNEEFRRVWTSIKVDDCISMIEKYGEAPGGNPFLDNDTALRQADIVFEYTLEEIEEIRRCANDVIYFGNTYCRAMTDEGVQNIKLRDYQERVLKSFQDNRFNVFLASRQIGKCFISNTLVNIRRGNKTQEIPIYVLFYALIKRQRKLTFYEKLKIKLYDIESYLTYSKIYKLDI